MGAESGRNPSKTPEQKALYNFLDLGLIALKATQTLEETTNLLERTERVVAPEGFCLLVTPINSLNLIVEKYFPPTEDRQGRYSQHFPDEIEEIAGIRIRGHGEEGFIGRYIEYDRDARGFYIYHTTGESRVLHRVDGITNVHMTSLENADELYPTQS